MDYFRMDRETVRIIKVQNKALDDFDCLSQWLE